jgi:hypothetical protein
MPSSTFAISTDEEPTVAQLADDGSAWAQAVRLGGEMLCDAERTLPTNADWRIDVTDGNGRRVCAIRIRADRFS